MSSEHLSTGTRAKKRLDYRQLNDGSDDEADIADRMEQLSILPQICLILWIDQPSKIDNPHKKL